MEQAHRSPDSPLADSPTLDAPLAEFLMEQAHRSPDLPLADSQRLNRHFGSTGLRPAAASLRMEPQEGEQPQLAVGLQGKVGQRTPLVKAAFQGSLLSAAHGHSREYLLLAAEGVHAHFQLYMRYPLPLTCS